MLDANAYRLLMTRKKVLKENGYEKPTFSDAVRLACGRMKVAIDTTTEHEQTMMEEFENGK